MPIYERVLVVERIIQELGLGGIRDSLVGTVEKRGVSGGQRKRVNVGLELAIEPSLLILDEPTSGLDSTSSRLVLQALRREAMEGVNVILVVHQPRCDPSHPHTQSSEFHLDDFRSPSIF